MKEKDDFTPDVPIKQLIRGRVFNATQQKPEQAKLDRYERYQAAKKKKK